MFDCMALGELLIDFTPSGHSEQGNQLFERNPGGAPANVLVALSKLGGSGAFIGKVGKDAFGYFLSDVLKTNGIDTSDLLYHDQIPTTLAFVHLDEKGDRSFSFYRNPGADVMLSAEDLNLKRIELSKVFHFGSVSMTQEPSRSATLAAARHAKGKKVLVSFDPNLRPALWRSLSDAKELIAEGMALADILKLSEEELVFITGETGLEEGVERLLGQYQPKVLLITLGEKGCYLGMNDRFETVPGFNVRTIDTTGAGDAFVGGLLFQLTRLPGLLDGLSFDDLKKAVIFANGVGALATTKRGAIPAMPSLEEVDKLIGK